MSPSSGTGEKNDRPRSAGQAEMGEKLDFSKNNLDKAASPYLRQHSENPVRWQEWSREVLDYAAREDKPLLVSVGYSTCHWCHVMAGEAFSDPECAEILNRHFVAVKVDREERPDIDQYLMDFLTATTGHGGWPLNAFLSPDLKPFFAMSYAPVEAKYGMPGFAGILTSVLNFYQDKKEQLQTFEAGEKSRPGKTHREAVGSVDFGGEACREIDRGVLDLWDRQNGGIRGEQKFPPHSTLLYTLHRLASSPDSELRSFVRGTSDVRGTLDVMERRGLRDHAGGGFFRYCVDEKWTIPHFEKMLYDQALLLWNYSTAARVFDEREYRETASGIVGCLENDFLEEGLYCAGLDADTDHVEGATYLWSHEELRRLLTPRQFEALQTGFELDQRGNFEGRIHLVGQEGLTHTGGPADLKEALGILAEVRKDRPQPFRDRKKLTAWNCLAGIGLLQAQRQIGHRRAGELAGTQLERLLALQPDPGGVVHGVLDERIFPGKFLGDHAAMLLLLTFHHEERRIYREEIEALRESVQSFRTHGTWRESEEADFLEVPAGSFDNPVPSSAALAETALARAAMVLGEEYPRVAPGKAFMEDFRNLGYLMTSGLFYWITGPEPNEWEHLPIASVQGEGEQSQYCYAGVCRRGLPSRSEGMCVKDVRR